MDEKILLDEEDRRAVISEMIHDLQAETTLIMDSMLDLRLQLTTLQHRIEILRSVK